MNSNGKRALVLIVTIAALALASSAVVAFLASDVDNYGVPETSVGPGTQNVLTMDVQLPENAGEDVKYFDGDRISGIGDAITPFDSTTALAGFLNVAGIQDGDTGVAFHDDAMFKNSAGYPAPANDGNLDPNEPIWVDANANGEYDAGETVVFAPDNVAPLPGTKGMLIRDWLGYAPGATARAYFRNLNNPGVFDANEIIFFDSDGTAPAGTVELDEVIFPNDLTPLQTSAFAGAPETNTFGGTPAREVWFDANGDGNFRNTQDLIWDDTQSNSQFDREIVVAGAIANGTAGTQFPANTRFENGDGDFIFEPGTEAIWYDVTANNQYDATDDLRYGGAPSVGTPGVTNAQLTNGSLRFVDNAPAGLNGADPLFRDLNGSGLFDFEPIIQSPAIPVPEHGTAGTAFTGTWSFSDVGGAPNFDLVWIDEDNDNVFDYDAVVYNPAAYTGDEWVVIDGGGLQYVGSNWVPVPTGIFSSQADSPISVGFDGVNAFAGAPLTRLDVPYLDVNAVLHPTVFADTGPAGYDDGDEVFDDFDGSMTYSQTFDALLVDGTAGLPAEGAALTEFPDQQTFVDFNGDGLWQPGDEPMFNDGNANLVLDLGEGLVAGGAAGAGSLTPFAADEMFLDINGSGFWNAGEPMFRDADQNGDLDVGEVFIYPSGPGSLTQNPAGTYFFDLPGGVAGAKDPNEPRINDSDGDLRADIGEAVLEAGTSNILNADNTGPMDWGFVDLSPRDGAFQFGEAVVFEGVLHNGAWQVGELVIIRSDAGAATRFVTEKYFETVADGQYTPGTEDIFVDLDGGGRYSTRPDALRKDVASKTTAIGDPLEAFEPGYMFWNARVESDPASPVNGYDQAEGDEIFIDLDGDGFYTAAADEVLYQGSETYPNGFPIQFFGTNPGVKVPNPGFNFLAGWTDTDGDGTFDGDAGAEEDIYDDRQNDRFVDTRDDMLTSITITNPYQAQEPDDISGLFIWTDADSDGVFDPSVDTNWGQAALVAPKAPGDNRTWTLSGVEIPALSEDRNGDGDVNDSLNEDLLGIDFNGDGDLEDVVNEATLGNGPSSAYPTAKKDAGGANVDSQTNLFVTVNISDDPQQILMGNNFDATIPVDGMFFASQSIGPEDEAINNASAPGAGLIHIDNNAPSVTKIVDVRLFGFHDFNQDGLVNLDDGVSIFATGGVAFTTAISDLAELEPNDTCPTAQALPAGVGFRPATLEPTGDFDYLSFTAVKGQFITVGTAQDGDSLWTDTVIRLYNEDCSVQLAVNDDIDYPENPYSLISNIPAPYTGTYKIRIHGFGGDTGTYRAFVNLMEPNPAILADNEYEVASPKVEPPAKQLPPGKSGGDPAQLNDVLEGFRLTELEVYTPSDNDVLFLRMQYADFAGPGTVPPGGAWTDLNYDPAGDAAGDGGAPGFDALDDDSDWVIANDVDGDGRPSVGEVGVDEMDAQVAQAIAAWGADFVDNDQDGYVDDFEYEAPGTDLDNDGSSGEGFAVDVDGDGIPGEPDPTPSDNTYTASTDDDEDGVDGVDYVDGLGAMDRVGTFFVRSNFNFVVYNDTPQTNWTWQWDTYLTQLRLSGIPLASVDGIWVKAVAFDQAENSVDSYAAPSIFMLDNTAPAATFTLTTEDGTPVPEGGTIYDDEVYHAGAVSASQDVRFVELLYAKNDETTFGHLITDATHTDGRIAQLEEHISWTPDFVTNNPADTQDDYYFVARAADRLEWYNITTGVWQPYVWALSTDPTANIEIGNEEQIIMGNDLPPDLAELHAVAVDGSSPHAIITRVSSKNWFDENPSGYFPTGVRVPAYNAVEIWVHHEDLDEDGLLGTVTETNAEAYMECDLNGDGSVTAGVSWDLNLDGSISNYSEDLNANGRLDDLLPGGVHAVDDGDEVACQNDISKIEFEYTNDHVTWLPIATVTGTIEGGHVADFTYPVVVTWDTTDPAQFPEGEYDIRAVAYDVEGNADPNPWTVTVTVDRSGLNAYFSPHGSPADSSTICGIVDLHSVVYGSPADDVGSTRVLYRYIRGEEAQSPVADIVFLIDSSSSMQLAIDRVKNATSSLAGALAATGVDYRLGLLDLAPGGAAPPVLLQDLTSDVPAFQAALNTLNVLPDALCASYDALVGANASSYGISWRANSDRVLVLVTDTVPELGSGAGLNYCATPNPAEENAVIAALGSSAKVFAITSLAATTPCAGNAYDQITLATGGLLYDINASDYAPILNEIAGTIVGGFWAEIGADEDADVPAGTDETVWRDYVYPWDTNGLPSGWVTVEAIALDELGNSDADRSDPGQRIHIFIDNEAPTPSFVQPADGTVISENDGNTVMDVLIDTNDYAGTDQVILEWSFDGVNWHRIDGINNDEDFFADSPLTVQKMYDASDGVYTKGEGNTDLTKVEVGDHRNTAISWTVPTYLTGTVVAENDQDRGWPLLPLMRDGVLPDPNEPPVVDAAPERTGPYRFVWLTKNTLGELENDRLVYLRATATQHCEGGEDLAATTQIVVHVTDNVAPNTTLITVTEPDGDILPVTGTQTLANTLGIFATAADHDVLDQQGSVVDVSLWFRPREQDLDADGLADYDLLPQPGAVGDQWMAWTRAASDSTYPFIFDWDVADLNGPYELAIVATDSQGNRSVIDETKGGWLMITHMQATVTDPLDETINEGAIITIFADLVSNPIDDAYDIVRFYRASAELDEPVMPAFTTQGAYAGFWVADLLKNIQDPDGDALVGSDVRLDINGTAGTYRTFADLAADPTPAATDFTIDYATNQVIFAGDPGADVTLDYHTSAWILIAIGDEADPYTVDWQTARDGSDNGVWSIMARAETQAPLTNKEPPLAEWALITVLDTDSPNFHVGGLGHQDVDDPAFYELTVAKLGNSINELSSLPPETKLSGDEVDLLLVDDDAPADSLDPATVVARLINETTGLVVAEQWMTRVAEDITGHAYMPVTFKFFEADWYHLVTEGDFENVTLFLDRDGDGTQDLLNELYPMVQSGNVWTVTVAEILEGSNLRYQFLVDTIGDNFDINGNGTEDPVDDPRNDTNPISYDTNPVVPDPTPWHFNLGDSRIILPSNVDYWTNVDISTLPDGVYRWEFSGSDGNGATSTVGKRTVIDRTPITQTYAVNVMNNPFVHNALEPLTSAPAGWLVGLQTYLVDQPGGVNIVDPAKVLFQYYDGQAWRWATIVDQDDDPVTNGWFVTWTTPVPGSVDDNLDNNRNGSVDEPAEGDRVDNDNDGIIDEADEAQSIFKIRAVVFDDGFNVSYTPEQYVTNLTIDGMPALAEVKLASIAGGPAEPVNGAVVRIGDPVTFFGQYTSAEKPVAVVFQWSPSPADSSWHDIDVTPVNEDDDYFTPIMGVMFETPDLDDETVEGGTHYYTATLNTESIRQIIFDDLGRSGDAYVEVRALAVDAVGNLGEQGRTSLVVLNDMDGPVAYFFQLVNLTNMKTYWPDDPLMAFTGQAYILAVAVGMSPTDPVTGTLQISANGTVWEDVSTVPLSEMAGFGNKKLFTWTMDTNRWADGMYQLRTLVRDADGNIGGDTDGNGQIDGTEHVPVITVRFDHTPPAAVLIKAGGLPMMDDGTTLIIPDYLPEETEFVPVLPSTVTFKAEDDGDSSTDIDQMTLEFRDDYRFPREDETAPRWLTIGTFEYRDYSGNDPDGDVAANGQWILEYTSLVNLYAAMQNGDNGATAEQAAMKAYQFRPLATDYAGNASSDDPGQSLRIDAAPPTVLDLFAGTAEMEGGGTDTNTSPLHVAGGDVAPLGAAVTDDNNLYPGGALIESGGMYGVRMEFRPASSTRDTDWTTIGLMAVPAAPYPSLWTVSWTTPTNTAWADSLFSLRATARDSAGNVAMYVRLGAVEVQDVTAPCNTRLTDVVATGGQIVPQDVTETTLENGTWVGGSVALFATTAAGDQSMVPGGRALVNFEAHRVGTPADQWILIQSASDTVSYETLVGVDNTLGEDWSVNWNTLAIDGNGAAIFPDGQWDVRAYAIDVHGNSEKDAWTAGTCSAVLFSMTVDNTAPMATMDFDPSTPAVETEGTVERNQVFTAFARTETETEDDIIEFMYKLHTDLNVPSSWRSAQPGYDDSDVNPDETRPYSFDWDLNQMTPMLTDGATYDVVAAASDLLLNQDTAVMALLDNRGLQLHVVDTIAPKATITKLVRAVGDEREVEFPEEEHVRGALEIWATILKGDHDTEFVDFYYRAEGATDWILADGDRDTTGDFTWVLRNWDTTPLAEGRYQMAAIAEDDAGNRDNTPGFVTLIVDHTAPTATWLPVEGDVDAGDCILPWQPGFTAAMLTESETLSVAQQQVMIPNRGPNPRERGWVAPHGTAPDSISVYSIMITQAGEVGGATFDWSASNGHHGAGLTTGEQVMLEGTVWVQFTPGVDSDGLPTQGPDFLTGDVFTFSTDGRIVDLITVSTDTDTWRRDDTGRPIYEYKLASDPDDDPFWTYATITPSTPLVDDILNTYSTSWDISSLESCLYDLRVTYDDRAGNRNIINYTNVDGSFRHVTVDNIGPEVAITNIANNGNDTTVDPVDFGTITDVSLGTAVKIYASADDDEQCLPASAETYVNKLQFQVLASEIAGGTGAADIVWVVDGSGSMGPYQAAIAANAQLFADALAGRDIQLGVVWFDTGSAPVNTDGNTGAALAGTGQFTSSPTVFGAMVQAVGSGHGATEDGLNALAQTLQHYTFRPGAEKFFVLVTDAGAQVTTSFSQVLPVLNGAGVSVFAILDQDLSGGESGDTSQYVALAQQTAGQVYDINGDFGVNLAALGVEIGSQISGGGWQDLGIIQPTFNAGDPTDVTAFVVWNTTGLAEGTYFLRVLAYDTACNMTISKVVQVNVKDNTPPIARIAGFDPDVIPHGDEPNTESTVYALTYSDDEIVEVQFQYDIVNADWPADGTDPDGLGWINIGIGTEVIGNQFPKDNLWMAKFNLTAFDASVVERMRVRALAKDSDGNRDDVNAPVLVADLVMNPDQSMKLVPVLDFNRITNVFLSAPSEGNVVLKVSTADPSEKPKAIAVSEDLQGNTTEQIVDFVQMVDSDVTWTGVLNLSGIANCGEMNISVTALAERENDILNPATPDTIDIEMQETLIASYQVTDALGTNGVVGIDGLTVYIPSGNGVDGCLLLAPTEAPTVSYDQGLYVTRFGGVYDIEWTSGGGPFDLGYNALVTMSYTDADLEALGLKGNEQLIMPRWLDQSGNDYDDEYWSAVGVTHVSVDTLNNIVTFRAASLDSEILDKIADSSYGVGSIWSLFVPTANAPVYVYNFQPWSNGFTDRDPKILAYLNDYSGEGIDEDEIEVWIDNRIVAASGTGYVLGNGDFDVEQVNNDGTMYEVTYKHSDHSVDLLPAGSHTLNIRFRTFETDTWVDLDPAAAFATFGVDRKAPTVAFRGGFVADPLLRNIAGYIGPTNFLSNPHTMLQAQAFDGESGIHVREEQTQDPISSYWDEGLKYDLWLVDWEDDQNDVDEIEERVLLHQGTADELLPYLEPPIDGPEGTPVYSPDDTLLVSMPIVGGGAIDDRDILEVTLYSVKEIEENSDGPGFGCGQLDTMWVGTQPVVLCDGLFLDMQSQEMHIYLQGWRDAVGNSGSPYVEQRFIVDRSAPTVELLAPKVGACVSPSEDVVLTFRVVDTGAGVDATSLAVNLQGPSGQVEVAAPTYSGGTLTVTIAASTADPLAFGTYSGTVSGVDRLGNRFEVPFSFTVCTDNLEVFAPKVFPNPFNPNSGSEGGTARFSFTIGRQADVSLEIYDFAGDKVASLASRMTKPAGPVEIQWAGETDDGGDLANGVYIARLTVTDGTRTQNVNLKVVIWRD